MDKGILIVICILMVIIIYIYISAQSAQTVQNDLNQTSSNLLFDKSHSEFTIIEQLRYSAKTFPDKIALKIKGESKSWKEITYKEYYHNVEKFACAIRKLIGVNVNTAIIGFNSPGWFFAHLGCMMNGGISVGMYTTSTKEICEHIIRNSNIRLLVVEDSTQLEKFVGLNLSNVEMIVYYSRIEPELVNKFTIPVLAMGSFVTKLKRIDSLPKLNDVATLIYTSGTTGLPKGVEITHDNIMVNLKSTLQMIKMKSSLKLESENFVSYLPLNHIAAQMMDIYLPIGVGGTVWFADKNALKSTLGKTLYEVKPTIFVGVPRVWEKICEQIQEKVKTQGVKGSVVKMIAPSYIVKELGLENCKFAVSLAAPISESSRDYLSSIGIKLYDIYGMSETTGPISLSFPNLEKKGSVGMPIMKVKIHKKHSDDPCGEILVKGKNLFSGYHGNKKAYQDAFKDNWFKTGDLGYLDNEGFLYVTGRIKELIITAGGENISPVQIEKVLKDRLGKYFNNIIVVGDKRKFLSLLLNDNKIKLPETISAEIETAITEVNNLADSNACTIKKWTILKSVFKIGDELTPTLKIKRDIVNKKYQKEINKLYK
jgi:long-chain-fatty-acid--CoA ligase ACSBG